MYTGIIYLSDIMTLRGNNNLSNYTKFITINYYLTDISKRAITLSIFYELNAFYPIDKIPSHVHTCMYIVIYTYFRRDLEALIEKTIELQVT